MKKLIPLRFQLPKEVIIAVNYSIRTKYSRVKNVTAVQIPWGNGWVLGFRGRTYPKQDMVLDLMKLVIDHYVKDAFCPTVVCNYRLAVINRKKLVNLYELGFITQSVTEMGNQVFIVVYDTMDDTCARLDEYLIVK